MDLKTPPTKDDPQVRILHCKTCRSFDEIPDFNGHPDDDVTLQITLQKHPNHMGNMFKVPIKVMMIPSLKQKVLKQLAEGSSGLDVVSGDFYDTSATFRDDAMKCYSQHSRPKGGCPDFCSDKKRLLPNTAADRKEAGLAKRSTSSVKVYLCDFCPVKSFIERKVNEERKIG